MITSRFEGKTFKIYLHEVLHISIYTDNYLGTVSWIEAPGWWCIYLYMQNLPEPILLEYDNEERWKAVIKEIDENL